MFLTFALLTAAILALWVKPDAGFGAPSRTSPLRQHAWWLLYVGAIITALAVGILRPLGLAWLGLFAIATALFSTSDTRGLRALGIVGIVVLGAGLMAHALPGFNNPRVISDLRLTPDAQPYRLHLNFDKTSVGLFLLALLHPRLTGAPGWRTMLRRVAPVIGATVALLLLLSLLAGYVRFAPKFPREAPLFLWANLCLTCVAEEAFFRAFIQRHLALRWSAHPRGAIAALLVAAILFGLAHAAGGPTYVVLSTLAGVGYGLAYHRTGQRIEAAILTHFSVNALHFLFFTYPALAPSPPAT